MNRQEVFDKVVTHLLTQNEKSIAPGSINYCQYRGEKGRKCAIGCLISDEAYAQSLEGATPHSFHVREALRKSGVSVSDSCDDIAFLENLQLVHDAFDVELWSNRLRIVADSFNLSFNGTEDSNG